MKITEMKIIHNHSASLLSTLVVAGLVCLGAQASNAAVITVSTSAPVVDGADIALLPSGTTTTNPNDSTTAVWFDQPHQGQTFTTGADPAGYELSAVSLLHNYGPAGFTWTATGPWDVIIGTIDGSNNLIPIASETIPLGTTTGFTSSDGVGDWITFTLATPVVLSANTAYAFAVGINGGGNGAVFVRSNNDNDYTGGAAFSDSVGGNGFNNPTVSHGFDRIFHTDLAVVPEPSASLLTLFGLTAGLGWIRRRPRKA
jgi:hypothetical protein